MTTSPSPVTPSGSTSSGESPASLPPWRQWLSTLNWRRDPDYEQRMNDKRIARLRLENYTRQIENEILRVRSDSARIENETEQIENDIARIEIDLVRIENAIAQIEKESEQLAIENARQDALDASIRRLCFPPESSSIPPASTEPGCGPFSP